MLVTGFVLAIVRLTRWGRSNAEALDAVIGAIERQEAVDVKADVAAMDLPSAAQDVLDDKVAVHDAEKENPRQVLVLAREIGLRLGKKR